jgi:hypothetical protein
LATPDFRVSSLVDFSFENPADGRFKNLEAVEDLLLEFPNMVFKRVTSYCHYGYPYRKRTVFVTTLRKFEPFAPCPALKCGEVQLCGKHATGVSGSSNAKKNSIPCILIDELIEAWLARHDGRAIDAFLLLDVFSGYGSIESRVREQQKHGKWEPVFVFSNDIVKRAHVNVNLDMRKMTPDPLLRLAVASHWPEAWQRPKKLAVLYHVSTPCETYSQNALCKHRMCASAVPTSLQAREADLMNSNLIEFFRRVVLTAPTAPAAPHVPAAPERERERR